ncbi:hypothetical protein PIB30_001726, partial [Stylosanthes scabra]|nr:hypothetical protein [Stylosanthes scabra]
VAHALGLNGTGDLFDKKIDNKTLNDEQKAAVKSFKGATSKKLKKIVLETIPDTEENKRKFKRAFILYVQKIFLCANNTMPLSPKHFPPIVDVENTRQMNWARHVCSFLLDGIIDMKKRNLKGVEGCVFALLIIYLHETRFGKDSEDEKAQPPWVKYWKGETLKKRMKVEKTDSTQRKDNAKKKKTSKDEDDPKEKKKVSKRKRDEEDEIEDESEDESEDVSSESESENEIEEDSSETESDAEPKSQPDSEETMSQK